MRRRALLAGLAALAAIPAGAHTPYRQWTVYRRKHLLIGCHREDLETWEVAKRIVAELDAHLPEAKARVARARTPGRLASLMATDQLDLAVLAPATTEEMAAGQGAFAAYGAIPLTRLIALPAHVLVAHAGFRQDHAWLVAGALAELDTGDADLALHPGAEALRDGLPRPGG